MCILLLSLVIHFFALRFCLPECFFSKIAAKAKGALRMSDEEMSDEEVRSPNSIKLGRFSRNVVRIDAFARGFFLFVTEPTHANFLIQCIRDRRLQSWIQMKSNASRICRSTTLCR
jgi:hypothetical protein